MIEVRLTLNFLYSYTNTVYYVSKLYLIFFAENTILESDGKLYIDNVHLKLNNSDTVSSIASPADRCENTIENIKVSPDDLHDTCSECFQKIEDKPINYYSTLAISPERIRRRRLSRQFSA